MNERAYNDLRDAIKKALSKEDVYLSDLDLDYDRDMLGNYLTGDRNLWQSLNALEDDRYDEKYKGKDRAERVEEEVVARCCESFLRDSKFVRQMAEQHYRSAREITRFLKQFAKDVSTVQVDAAVRAYEGGYDTNDISPENNMLRDFADIEKIADLWARGLREIADKRAKAKKATGEIKASLKTTQHMTWDDQMKQYFSKDHGTLKSSDTLCVGKSGSKYSGFAMKDSLIGVPQSTVTKGMREKKGSRSAHELSKTNIINLGKGIMNPVAIVDNENRDCVYVVLDDSDPAGNPVIAVINKNRSIDYTDAHEVISAFGMKDFLSYIREHVPKGSRIEVFDKQKLSKRLLGNDVQFVELGTSLREFANVIIHDDSESVKRSEQTKASISDREYIAKRDQYRIESESIKNELQDVRAKLQSVEELDNYKSAFAKLSDKSISDEDWKAAVDEFARVEVESGHDALYKRQKELIEKQSNLSKEWDKVTREKEQADYENAVKESGLTEAEYSRKQAVKEFGYTPYYYDAGYILPNGKMLNFSGEKGRHYGSRGQDHRAIGTIYPDSQGSDAMIRFMKDGNIRIMAETPGIDLSSSVEPTREQYATIRAFAENSRRKEYFNVDLSDEHGDNVGTLEYDGNVNPTRIINDIKHFYETGEVREPSSISQFHYSIMDKDFRMTKRGSVRTFEQNGTTANVIGSSVELEGGSLLNRVRMMQNLAEEYGSVRVDAASEKEAEAFKRAGAEQDEEGLEGRGAEYGTWEFKYQRQLGQDICDPKQKVKFAKVIVKYKMPGIAA